MKYALVIIDMLNDFFDRNPRLKKLKKALCKNSNELIRFARQKKVPVIWIRQEFKSDLSDAFLIMRKKKESVTIKGTKGCKVLEELNRKTRIIKRELIKYLFYSKSHRPYHSTIINYNFPYYSNTN